MKSESFYIQLNSAITDLPQNCDYFDKSQLKNFYKEKKMFSVTKRKKRSISISRFCLHLKDGRKKKRKYNFKWYCNSPDTADLSFLMSHWHEKNGITHNYTPMKNEVGHFMINVAPCWEEKKRKRSKNYPYMCICISFLCYLVLFPVFTFMMILILLTSYTGNQL